ncbi:hypothetical protein MZO42_11575 [Sphingomonas psychrotolerans]|uniref:Benenodin family lasso peptide n=1 Tax=Sphingomonas psychrotolerans TaxID=1327635 RepID=A0ABU3N4M6_9SPHN|nr:hypothetical protein [Sphingomonas psychrotolerans]MDT8759338.1 hypothetical protein [Sphingomonas psychrotolerans]
MERVLSHRLSEHVRELDGDEIAAVAGGSRILVPRNPDSGNLAGDEAHWEFD